MMKLTDKVLVLSGVYKEQIFMANDSFFSSLSFFLFLGVIRLLESGIYLREVSSQRYPVFCCQSVKLGVSVTKIHQEKKTGMMMQPRIMIVNSFSPDPKVLINRIN